MLRYFSSILKMLLFDVALDRWSILIGHPGASKPVILIILYDKIDQN